MDEAAVLGAQAMEEASKWVAIGQEFLMAFGLKALAAIAILIVGR